MTPLHYIMMSLCYDIMMSLHHDDITSLQKVIMLHCDVITSHHIINLVYNIIKLCHYHTL